MGGEGIATFRCLVCQREFDRELERCPTCSAIKGHSSVMADGAPGPAPVRSEGSPAAFELSFWMFGWFAFVVAVAALAIAITEAPLIVGIAALVVLLGGLVGFDF